MEQPKEGKSIRELLLMILQGMKQRNLELIAPEKAEKAARKD